MPFWTGFIRGFMDETEQVIDPVFHRTDRKGKDHA